MKLGNLSPAHRIGIILGLSVAFFCAEIGGKWLFFATFQWHNLDHDSWVEDEEFGVDC